MKIKSKLFKLFPNQLIPLFFVLIINCIQCDLNKNRTFINLEKPIPCIRRFNSTHQIGCGKEDYSSYDGVVYAVRNQIELNRLKSLKDLGMFKLVVVTVPKLFSSVVDFHKSEGKLSVLNGIVLVAIENYSDKSEIDLTTHFNYSDDLSSPNNVFSLYGKNQTLGHVDWNKAGRGYMFENFDIPFYVIYDKAEAKEPFENCYDKFNKKVFEQADKKEFKLSSNDLLCGMQLGLEMSGAVSTKVCARRSSIMHTVEGNLFCDPLGGSNYLSFLSQAPSNSKQIVILSARLDTFTMFDYYTPGANEPISSLIGLFAIAELLSKYRNNSNNADVLFVLFDNEAFDYGGSSRFASDLVKKQFPSIKIFNDSFVLDKENITSLIELNQLGAIGLSDGNNLFVHRDPVSYGSNKKIAKIIDDLISVLKNTSNGTINMINNINQQLPPSSIHSFISHNIEIGAISISDHEKEFKNIFYHSVFDTAENLNITFPDNITEFEAYNYTTNFSKRLQTLTTSIAQAVYLKTISNSTVINDQVDQSTLNKLVYCFYKNASCDYFKSMLTNAQWTTYLKLLDANLPKGRLSFYTGVNDNLISGKWISHMLLRYFTRNLDIEGINSTDCNKDSDFMKNYQRDKSISIKTAHFGSNSKCVASSVYSVSSTSPAFKNFENGELVNTDKYSAWSESSWNGVKVQMKMFMFTAKSVSALTLSLGIITFVLASFATFFVNKNSEKWFTLNNREQVAEFFE